MVLARTAQDTRWPWRTSWRSHRDDTWAEAEPILRADPLVVVPVGAAAKEHGLPLGTDRIMADYLARKLAERVEAVILPTVTYGSYPHFVGAPISRLRHLVRW